MLQVQWWHFVCQCYVRCWETNVCVCMYVYALLWSKMVFCANSWEAQSGTLRACPLLRPSGSSSSRWRGRTSATSTSAWYHRYVTLVNTCHILLTRYHRTWVTAESLHLRYYQNYYYYFVPYKKVALVLFHVAFRIKRKGGEILFYNII